jgi:hypothetical protein
MPEDMSIQNQTLRKSHPNKEEASPQGKSGGWNRTEGYGYKSHLDSVFGCKDRVLLDDNRLQLQYIDHLHT